MSNVSSEKSEFTGWRALFWPIHKSETKRFVALASIMCCILFNYTMARNTKDALVVSAAGAGTTTFLKLYFVTPVSIIFLTFFAKLSKVLSRENIFYALVLPFLIFFALFAIFLNPFAEVLHPAAESIARLKEHYPRSAGFINIYGSWVYCLYFVMAEMWGTVVLSLAFWGFINQTTPMKQAKRFYGMFAVIGNLSLIACGQVVSSAAKMAESLLPVGSSNEKIWQWSVNIQTIVMVVIGFVAIALFKWLHISIINQEIADGAAAAGVKKKKKKPGVWESMKVVFTSPDLGLIVMLVISYGVTINLAEVQWKNQVALHFAGDKVAMNTFFGKYSFWTGITTVAFALFLGSNILRKFSWLFSALFTPVVTLITGGAFFLAVLGQKYFPNMATSLVGNPVWFATLMGAVVVIMSKAAKYCLFDPTKEMAYIPLDEELKSTGKAAVDVVGGRLGKSGGAFVQSMLFIIMGTTNVLSIAPIAGLAFIAMSLIWVASVKRLSIRLKSYSKDTV